MKLFIILLQILVNYSFASVIYAGHGVCQECYNSGKTMCLIGGASNTQYDTGMCCSG